MRPRARWLVLTAGLASMVLVGPSPARAQVSQTSGEDCPWAKPDAADIGIERLRCVGGECEINVASPDGGLEHRFSTEPRIDRLRSSAPDAIRQGDVITSVDGRPITTRAGGRQLARLEIGREVTLGLRRGERHFDIRLTPRAGCPIGGLAVRAASASH